MTKSFCDFCKSEIQEGTASYLQWVEFCTAGAQHTKELCPQCFEEFSVWLAKRGQRKKELANV